MACFKPLNFCITMSLCTMIYMGETYCCILVKEVCMWALLTGAIWLGPWRAAYHPTTTHFPELPDQEASTKLAWIRSYRHVAPECFSENPPPYSPKQEVYSLSHQIKRLLDSLPPSSQPLLTRFVRSMYKKVEAGLEKDPDQRPDAFTLSCCIQGISNFGVPIVKSSGLRPIDD